jgi:Mn-dependent DtxR family transcriptional regulator
MSPKQPRRTDLQRTLDKQARARRELMRRNASRDTVTKILKQIEEKGYVDHPDRDTAPAPKPRWWARLWTFLRGGTA